VSAGLRGFRARAWVDSGSPATVRKDRAKSAIDPKNSRQCARMKSLKVGPLIFDCSAYPAPAPAALAPPGLSLE